MTPLVEENTRWNRKIYIKWKKNSSHNGITLYYVTLHLPKFNTLGTKSEMILLLIKSTKWSGRICLGLIFCEQIKFTVDVSRVLTERGVMRQRMNLKFQSSIVLATRDR